MRLMTVVVVEERGDRRRRPIHLLSFSQQHQLLNWVGHCGGGGGIEKRRWTVFIVIDNKKTWSWNSSSHSFFFNPHCVQSIEKTQWSSSPPSPPHANQGSNNKSNSNDNNNKAPFVFLVEERSPFLFLAIVGYEKREGGGTKLNLQPNQTQNSFFLFQTLFSKVAGVALARCSE